jgi:hypothetical protein
MWGALTDTNTLRHIHARLHNTLIIRRLLRQQSVRGRSSHPNIQLRDCNINIQFRKLFKILLNSGGHGSRNKMCLCANAIDRNTRGLEFLDEIIHGGGLRSGGFDVVVVDTQLCVGVGRTSRVEGNADIFLSDCRVEDVLAEAAVFVEL